MSNVPTQTCPPKPDEDGRWRILQLVQPFDRNIDALIYELYGLTDEEITIVEETK